MTDRLLTLWVLVVAANPAVFALGPKEGIYLWTLLLLAVVCVARGARPTGRDLWILACFAAISAAHALAFGPEVLQPSLGFLVRLAIALLAVRAVRGFHERFAGVMVAVSLLSFLFWAPVQLGVDLPGMLSGLRVPIGDTDLRHVGVHNFHTPEHASRNSGMFNEPGMFAGYLVLAMLLLLRPGTAAARPKWAVLLVALLTTQSTTGYIALGPLLVMAVTARRAGEATAHRVARALPALAAVLAVAFVAYRTVPFIGEKIEHQVEQAFEETEGAEYNRIGNLLYDFRYIEERPLLGWSPRHATRTTMDPDVAEVVSGQGNGLSGFVVRYGVVGFGLLLAWMFGALGRWYGDRTLAMMALCALAIVLTGEQFLNAPLFLALAFSPDEEGDGEPASPGAYPEE